MNQLVKDHKETLKTRPVCRAKVNQIPNGPLADLVCEIVNPFVEEADRERRTEVGSTEELCAEIKAANDRIEKEGVQRGRFQRDGSLIVGSKDVEAHYPNIDVEVAAEELKQEIQHSNLEVEVDTVELALYLASTMCPEEIEREGLVEVVHKRRFNRGPRPGLTSKAIMGGPAGRQQDNAWIPPVRIPTRGEKMRMIGCMVRHATELVMKNHFYTVENEIRKQNRGGAIGNKLTERLGKILMKRHSQKYLKLLEKLELKNELFETYVDDTTDVIAAVDPGVRFDGEKLVRHDELVEVDKTVPEDKRTMEVLKDIANTIYDCVQFTVDCPSNNDSGKVPVLDLNVYIRGDQIVHEFYEKPCASKMVIPYSSAHSKKMKMAVLVEEGLRRLRNTSRGLEQEESRRVMAIWSRKLKRSGYPATVRHEVIKTACEKWEKMCNDEDSGGRPIFRPRGWKKEERRLQKERKATNWHQRDSKQASAPLILDPTAGSLTRDARDVCAKFEQVSGMRVSVVERAGQAIKHLAKSEPLKRKGCGREKCFPCRTGGGNCEKNGVAYRVRCETCRRAGKMTEYEGESGYNGFTRGCEHEDAVRLGDQNNALYKHCVLEHGGAKAEFSMRALASYQSCLVRQVNEAVRIGGSKAECIMNSKAEFHQAPLVRVVPVVGLEQEQGEREERRSRVGRGG